LIGPTGLSVAITGSSTLQVQGRGMVLATRRRNKSVSENQSY
jgi:hypothetical protein